MSSCSDDSKALLVDQKKRKRMLSNRDSARRSRMRKQQRLEELVAEELQLKKDNDDITNALRLVTQNYVVVEAENSVIRTQMMELSTRLESLNGILECMNMNGYNTTAAAAAAAANEFYGSQQAIHDSFFSLWNLLLINQPIMASVDMF